jgi:hypothetical protein
MARPPGRPAPKKVNGYGFFDDLKNTFSKPSSILSGLSLLPTPLSPLLGIAGTVTGLAGKGLKHRKGTKKAGSFKLGKGTKRKKVTKHAGSFR